MRVSTILRFTLAFLLILDFVGDSGPRSGTVRQLTDVKSSWFGEPTIDGTGSKVWVNTSTNRFGDNPSGWWQVFEFDAVTGSGAKLTNLGGGVEDGAYVASVTDDGEWITFVSAADPLGLNHDRSSELFVIKEDGTGLAQLTNDPAPDAGAVIMAAIAGSGNRVAFVSSCDPLGTNPNNWQQLFVVERDGSNLAQLTSTTRNTMDYIDISNDGARITFVHSGDLTGGNLDLNNEIFAVASDGSGLQQLTSSTGPVGSTLVKISGDGSTVTFQSQDDLTGGGPVIGDIFAIDWSGANLRRVTQASSLSSFADWPAITDDGQWIFFHSPMGGPLNPEGNFEIWKIRSDGTSLTNLTASTAGTFARAAPAADGSRVVFMGTDADGSFELFTMDGSGGALLQLTQGFQIESREPDVTPDGSRVVFASTGDLTGANPDHFRQLFRVEADGSDLTQLTSAASSATQVLGTPSITADGGTIVFSGFTSGVTNVIKRINADGTGLIDLSPFTLGAAQNPVIADDGSVVVFDRTAGGTEVYRVPPDGSSSPVRLTFGGASTISQMPRIDGTGTWLVFESNANLDGTNADGSWEIFRMRSDGSSLKWVTSSATHDSREPDISADGTRIVYASTADPLGTNPDNNSEIFLFDLAGPALLQLTSTQDFASKHPRISGDGAWVYFISASSIVETERDQRYDAYRVSVATGAVERVAGLHRGRDDARWAFLYWWTSAPFVTPDADGDRAVLDSKAAYTDGNADRFTEIWLLDQSRASTIAVSGPAPTTLSWDVEVGPRRYDAIRGNTAFLQAGGPGQIDLGPVLCLENDSPDAETVGFEDGTDPPTNEAYFYLFRGSQGLSAGPGSYGPGSSGAERVAGTGDCAP